MAFPLSLGEYQLDRILIPGTYSPPMPIPINIRKTRPDKKSCAYKAKAEPKRPVAKAHATNVRRPPIRSARYPIATTLRTYPAWEPVRITPAVAPVRFHSAFKIGRTTDGLSQPSIADSWAMQIEASVLVLSSILNRPIDLASCPSGWSGW